MINDNQENVEEFLTVNGENIEDLVVYDDELNKILIEKQEQKKKLREAAKKLREEFRNTVRFIVTSNNEIKKETDLTLSEQTDELIKCASNPIYFIETYLTIFDQTKPNGGAIVPFKLFEFQKELINTYQNNRFIIANKYRQAGISTTTCAYLAWYIMFNENVAVPVVANKLDTARDELMSDIIDFIDQCPAYLKPDIDGKDAGGHKKWSEGRQLKAFAPTSLRGLTPTLLFWDETAWAESGEKFWSGTRATLQTGGKCIMVSTPNGMDATYYKTFNDSKNGKNDFKAVELWWFNDPRYNKDLVWIKNRGTEEQEIVIDSEFSMSKRLELKNSGYVASSPWFEKEKKNYNGNMKLLAQELLLDFLGSGNNFIPEDQIKNIDDNQVCEPLRQEYDNQMWIWEDPVQDGEYILSADVSSGHSDDNSTINIIKIEKVETTEKVKNDKGIEVDKKVTRTKKTQVAEFYGKVLPEILAELLYLYGTNYNNGHVVIDVTGGYGTTTSSKLVEMGYKNIYYTDKVRDDSTRNMLSKYSKKTSKQKDNGEFESVDVFPGFVISTNRNAILLNFAREIYLKTLIIKSSRLSAELKTFVTTKSASRIADHRRSFHDDTIMGMSIGLYVISFDYLKVKDSPDTYKAMINSMKKQSTIQVNSKIYQSRQQYADNSWLFKGLKH